MTSQSPAARICVLAIFQAAVLLAGQGLPSTGCATWEIANRDEPGTPTAVQNPRRVKTADLLPDLNKGWLGASLQNPDSPKKFALLVGCTQYPNAATILPLDGPLNDVAFFLELLTKQFAFPEADIVRLVGWPDNEKQRPTAKNIAAGFENLIKKAGQGDQVVILLSGHGTEVPISPERQVPLNPRNPKLDGTDKVFLAADAAAWNDADGLQGAILDDQIGRWLDRLAAKGAAVWIMLDCCHSGTMARDVDDKDLVRVREVRPQDLKIPAEAFADAARRAQAKAKGKVKEPPALPPSMLTVSPRAAGPGSVVAFYACQSFEQALELPLPEGAAREPGNYHGLMSYHLTAALKNQAKRLTYRELGQVLVAAFQASRGSHEPTPFCEGDLDREVLGLKVWPNRSRIILDTVGAKLGVNAGELQGLTPDSILAVHPPANDPRDAKEILGYVKVLSAEPGAAVVAPCAYKGKEAAKAAALPKLAICELIVQEMGEMRLRLAIARDAGVGGKPPTSTDLQAKRAANLAAALQKLSKDTGKLVLLTDDPAKADWLLRVEGDKIQLRPGDGRSTIDPQQDAVLTKAIAAGKGGGHTVYGLYNADNIKEIAEGLDRDLPCIFTWKNVWRIAGMTKADPADDQPPIGCELIKLKGTVTPDGPLEPGAVVMPGQRLALRVKNDSFDDIWVTVLYLDANFGIDIWFSDAIKGMKALKPINFTVTADSHGKEGFVVLAVPVGVHKNRPDFSFLKQSPLNKEQVDRGVNSRDAGVKAKTPFERLMAAGAFGGPGTRAERDVPDNPTTLLRSWVTLSANMGAAQKQP
jgi:hypothetical protein